MRKHLHSFAFLFVLLVLTAFPLQAQTPNQIPKFDSAGNPVDSTIAQEGNIIRIGTTSTLGRLHIAGPADADVFSGMGVSLRADRLSNSAMEALRTASAPVLFNVRPAAEASGPNPSLRFATLGVCI